MIQYGLYIFFIIQIFITFRNVAKDKGKQQWIWGGIGALTFAGLQLGTWHLIQYLYYQSEFGQNWETYSEFLMARSIGSMGLAGGITYVIYYWLRRQSNVNTDDALVNQFGKQDQNQSDNFE